MEQPQVVPVGAPVPTAPAPVVTGEPRVDAALATLATVDPGDPAAAVLTLTEVHRLLQDTLATLDGA